MNDDFEKQQRDPFVTEEGAAAKIDRLRDFLDDPDFEVIINDKNRFLCFTIYLWIRKVSLCRFSV